MLLDINDDWKSLCYMEEKLSKTKTTNLTIFILCASIRS
jgi:hypothetical protein